MKRSRSVNGDPRSRRQIRGFVLRFVAGWGVILFVLSAFPGIEDLAIRGTGASLASALRPFVTMTHGPDGGLTIGRLHWMIVPDCTPLMPTITLALAMIAYPASLAWKGFGLAAGAMLLWIFNLFRLVIQVMVELWLPVASDFVHVYFFQVLAFVLVCLLFVAWINIQQETRPA